MLKAEREVFSGVQVEKYPLSIYAEPSVCREHVERKTAEVLSNERFRGLDTQELLESFRAHYNFIDTTYAPEEHARKHNKKWADLTYHGRPHISQTTFDASAIILFLLNYNDDLGRHLKPEGILGGILGALYHDIGYIYPREPNESCASRTPIHVETSKKVVVDKIQELGGFSGLDISKMAKIAVTGIHGTHFPYSAERRTTGEELIKQFPQDSRMEAEIILKTLQLADLGGQTARKDQFNTGLRMLREEMNAGRKGSGDEIIGSNKKMNEMRFKFIDEVVIPTVGEIALEFFGSHDNPYEKAWKMGMNI